MRRNATLVAIVVTCFVARALASVTLTVDILDPTDGGAQPPKGIVVIDVLVNASSDDYWTASGFRGHTVNGARFEYAADPNNGFPVLVNPGTQNRFVTFLSQPRPRDGNNRFTNGAAGAAGRYCPTGASPQASSIECNLAWFRTPPTGTDGVDGAILRLAISVPEYCTGHTDFLIAPLSSGNPGRILILECTCNSASDLGLVAASHDQPAVSGIDWGLFVLTFGPPCLYDFDCNFSVDLNDLTQFLATFGSCIGDPIYQARTDFDGDDCTDLADLTRFLANFGRGYSPYVGCP